MDTLPKTNEWKPKLWALEKVTPFEGWQILVSMLDFLVCIIYKSLKKKLKGSSDPFSKFQPPVHGSFVKKLFQQMGFNEQNGLISGFTPSEI